MDNLLQNFDMYITKSSFSDGLMKWSAVNSDTESDLYGEKMTIELYRKMLSYIKNRVPPPKDFKEMVCSDYWCGGMPYLSLAHYSDNNGKAVPGQPLELFIDGTQLKARGILFDTKLGRAVWKSLKQDEMKQKSGVDDERIRISIAFLDLAHKHGDNGEVFRRNSISSICPECAKGVGQKVYVDGYLVHLALTRVPVNPRTLMEPEDIMAKKSQIQTRKEDAVSVVEDEALVEEVTKPSLEVKSEALVEMSDTEVADPEVKAEGFLTERNLLDFKEKHPDFVEALNELAKTKKDMPMEDEEDSMDEEEDKKESKKGKKECSLTDGDIEVIRSLILEALPKPADIVIKAIADPALSDTVSTPEPEVTKSALDIATDGLYNSVNQAINLQGATIEQRLEAINPALQALGNSITSLVRESMGVEVPAAVSNDQAVILEAITSMSNSVKELAQKVAIMEEKSQTSSANPVQSRIPAPRSIQPVVSQSQTSTPANPNSVSNIVRRSVSSHLPLK